MSENQTNNVQYLVIIADQKNKDKFISLISEFGGISTETVYGHGSMSQSAIAAAFGFESEQAKVVLSCLIRTDSAKELIDTLKTEYRFDAPNTGIAFTVPVEGLAF